MNRRKNIQRPVVLSGAQPTGRLTLGNYLGALRHWVAMQEDHDCLFCVVDLHALTVRQDPERFREQIFELAALYIACGIDPDKALIFIQSHVPAHAELAWILSTCTQLGELERMTQFKDKSRRHSHQDNVNAGLFTYPILMAADILLYDADKVPVGADQKQHLELTRDIAMRFNHLHGALFRVPEPMIPPEAARVKDLQDPTKKMSKSAESELARIMMLDSPQTILKKFKKAVTDSEANIQADEENQPGVTNLLTIWCAATGETADRALNHFSHNRYGVLKTETAEAVIALLEPIQKKYSALRADRDALEALLSRGAEQAQARAEKTMKRVMQALGVPLNRSRFHG